MDELKKEMIRLCNGYPEGLSIFEIHDLYQRTYGKPLHLGTTKRLASLQALLRSMPDHVQLSTNGEMTVWPARCRPASSSSPPSSSSSLASLCLSLSSSQAAAAGKVPPTTVKTRHFNASRKATFKMGKELANIVAIIKGNPNGIPVKKVAEIYSRTYHKNLTVADLGFKSMAALVASLDDELVVEQEMVFHRTHQPPEGAGAMHNARNDKRESDAVAEGTSASPTPDSQPRKSRKRRQRSGSSLSPAPPVGGLPLEVFGFSSRAGSRPESPAACTIPSFGFSPAPSSVPASTSKQTEKLSQGQLLQRLKEVMKADTFAAGSMERLGSCYVQLFGEALPLEEYMSLYDSWEMTNASMQAVGPRLTPTQPTEATPKDLEREPQSSALPYCLSSTDFPALGAEARPDKDPRTRQREEEEEQRNVPALGAEARPDKEPRTRQREEEQRNVPIFRDAYHAQLREVHGANVRAADSLAEDNEDLKGWRRNRVLDLDTVNSLAEDVIRDLASEGELVTQEKVVSRVCILLQVPSLKAGGIYQPWHIPAVKNLQYIIREINMFLESTEAATAICTLYELGQSLAGLKDKKHYEELNLGPLCKLPIIHRMFKIDSSTKDDDIRQIETVDILKSLRIFRRKQNKQKVDLAEFLQYLADQYRCESPYELGIRIHSVGLPIATLMKVTRCEHIYLERAQQLIQRELEEEVLERMRKVKRSVMEPAQGPAPFSSFGSLELRRKYVSMTGAEAVLAVFTNAADIFSPRMNKRFQDFLLQVSGDRLATALFQLAVCGGSLAIPQDLVPKEQPSKATGKFHKDEPALNLPSEAAVKQFLRDSLANQNSALTLAHVASLEKKLTKHFKVKEFVSLEKGTFLEFLVKHSQLLQETVGGVVSLGGGSTELQGCGFRPSRQDVFEFIKQCGAFTATDPDGLSHVERSLRVHYMVRDSRDLGFGPLRTLADLVRRQRDMLAGGGCSQVHYESAMFAKHSSATDGECESVGLLGELSHKQALASLLTCPLLEDLDQWSQWEHVFKPLHGPLKDFIERNAALPANADMAALEVSPGVLLRITTATGDKYFSQAAVNLDPVGTAGHLVSMAVADGIANVPTALLANNMETSLAAAVAKADTLPAEEDWSCYGPAARFLLECLIRIPTRTCQALLQQVFLEPLYRVFGQARSKAILLSTARSDQRHLNRLHQLGISLGVTDWIKDYQSKLLYTHTVTVDATKSDQVGGESSSLSPVNLGGKDDYLDDTIQDDSSESSSLNRPQRHAEGEKGDNGEEEDDDEEALYELTSLDNKEAQSANQTASESDGIHEAEDLSDPDEEEEEDGSGSEPGSEETFQRALIEDIRKSEFGVGVELTAEGKKLMKVHQERLGRSLDRLSTELYSKDAHFVLELIQNADDNNYPSEGDNVPALALVVERDCITVLNNETGFQEKNIRAICDVGRTTKGKHKYGYIGQKGIGFKSVFKVTDCPEIHSNGFHLRFDKTCGPMGYILPHWVDDERPLDMQLSGISQQSWTTKICLPLRSENQQTRNLFHDVHPSLLLFLHRLRSITIYNQCEKRVVAMTRRDMSHNVLEVEHTEGTERWLVLKRMLQPKKIKEDVESTELALAFLLGDSSTAGDVIAQPQKQPVFAFLPLRSFGFRFIIQGDFDIPSSREDVDRDSPWNQWLRSEIPQLFVQAMDVFNDHPDFSGLKGLVHFLQFVPLPDEVLDFFKPVARQIIQLLKGKAFLPTLNSAGDVEYKLPSQVAVCQDAVIREVIGREELERHLSLAYLHPDLRPVPTTTLLTHLGVRPLRGSDVTTVTTAMARELMLGSGLHTDVGLRRLARLLVCNFRALEYGYGESEAILQALRELRIIPLADGRVVALNDQGVFFPLEEAGSKKKKRKQNQAEPFEALYEDVSVVHPSLLSCGEPLEGQQVRELLRRMGVHDLEPQQLLEEHIFPVLRNDNWKSKADKVVVSYLVFIKQHPSACTSSWPLSDTAIPVLTSRGLRCPAHDRVHFSVEYNNIDLPQKLPGCDWLLLSPCYVETDSDVEGWRELLAGLGVQDRLIIRKERRTLCPVELASSCWALESETWPYRLAEEGCVLDDYPSEEFHSLATAQLPAPVLLEQRRALLELLESNWDTGDRYSQYLNAHVIDADGRQSKSTKSSFFHFLCHLDWVAAYRLLEGGTKEVEYHHPNSVYLVSPDVHDLLGTHVHYVDTHPSEFSRALGMRHSVSVEEMISYLKKWSSRQEPPHGEDGQHAAGEDVGSAGGEFTTTVQHIFNVYSYLQRNCPQGSLKELFQRTPAVFVEHMKRTDGWSSGHFYHLKEVCWSDPSGMFLRYGRLVRGPDSTVQEPRVLAPFYAPLEGMRDLFSKQLNVEPSPTMNQYVGLLELVCSSCPVPTAEVLQDVSVIYARLAQKCKVPGCGDQDYMDHINTNSSYCSTLKGMVSDKRVFPTKDNSWVTLSRRPMLADSRELEKIFKSDPRVCLLNLPPPDRKPIYPKAGDRSGLTRLAFIEEDRTLFLDVCGVRRLSRCVTTEAQTENLRACPPMQALVRSVVPYVQRFLYYHEELGPVYQELLANNIGEKIKRLHYGQVGKLYIRYQLSVGDELDSPLVELQDVVCLLKDEKELYIQKDHLSAKLDICRELVKLFCTESGHRKELMHFLSGLMTSLDNVVTVQTQGGGREGEKETQELQDIVALKRFLQKEDIRELPSSEEPWEVPEPPRPEMNLDRAPSRASASFITPEEAPRRGEEDGEQTLVCWPPRASMATAGSGRAGRTDGSAVEAVMKMWPPPAPPKDKDTERAAGAPTSHVLPPQVPHPYTGDGAPRDQPKTTKDHGYPGHSTRDGSAPLPPESGHSSGQTVGFRGGEQGAEAAKPNHSSPPPEPPKTDSDQPTPSSQVVPEVVLLGSTFQGTEGVAQRPPLAMDSPLWNKSQCPPVALEDMELACKRPTTVVLSDDQGDLAAIGTWGEQLVNSFLCHWRDSEAPGRPSDVTWCNQRGESGGPYDFKLAFGPPEQAAVYVEVKSTVKRDKAFIHLSANELDFALKERERYHIFRVYSAGDAQNVRLCRIRNLAQKLHAKDLELFLFV